MRVWIAGSHTAACCRVHGRAAGLREEAIEALPIGMRASGTMPHDVHVKSACHQRKTCLAVPDIVMAVHAMSTCAQSAQFHQFHVSRAEVDGVGLHCGLP